MNVKKFIKLKTEKHGMIIFNVERIVTIAGVGGFLATIETVAKNTNCTKALCKCVNEYYLRKQEYIKLTNFIGLD